MQPLYKRIAIIYTIGIKDVVPLLKIAITQRE